MVQAPKINSHFVRFGMEVHAGQPDKASKSEVLFVAAPEILYDDKATWDHTDLSDIDVGNGTCPVVSEFKYLGGILTRNCKDGADVSARIKAAGAAFGALRRCVFASREVSGLAKRAVYVGLVLSILLYGSECWCLTEVLYNNCAASTVNAYGRCGVSR